MVPTPGVPYFHGLQITTTAIARFGRRPPASSTMTGDRPKSTVPSLQVRRQGVCTGWGQNQRVHDQHYHGKCMRVSLVERWLTMDVG